MTEQAHTNGPSDEGKFIDRIDPEDPEYIRQLRRPAEVKEDVQQMDNRGRVTQIMKSQAFKEELEEVIADQLKAGPHPASLLALQQISELLVPQSKFSSASMFSKCQGPVIPVSDIRGVDSLNYSKPEKLLRCKVAACHRLVDLYGWAIGVQNHMTVRMNQEHEHFLVTPSGILYNEVSAGSLAKVNLQGEVLDPGHTGLGYNKAGYTLHSAIHAARPDMKALIHLQTPAAVSVSAMKCGLLPLSKEAVLVGEATYYEGYCGLIDDNEERDQLTRALGPASKVLFLRNNGVVIGGAHIEEAFYNTVQVMSACESQIKALPAGIDNLCLIPEESRQKYIDIAEVEAGGEGRKKWKKGEIEYEALMRLLDNAGFRTGYLYREPLMKRDNKRERTNSDVEVPPTSTNFNYQFDDEGRYNSPLKTALEKQKKQHRSEWLATPNAYKREEIEETGTPNPKKITKWVADESGSNAGTPVKIENPNQFAPQGTDPKELRQKHRAIRKDYYEEKVSAGPQSRILEGMTWEEAQRIKDTQGSGNADNVIVVGAASKGIIKREHQHNAVVYKTFYAPNPFDNMSEEEIAKYKDEVENKGKDGGDFYDTSVGPPGRLVSTEERLRQVRLAQAGDIEPGPDGKLISTEERMKQLREAEVAQQAKLRQGAQETNIDDSYSHGEPSAHIPPHYRVPPQQVPPQYRQGGGEQYAPPRQYDGESSPPGGELQRSKSARTANRNSDLVVRELETNFGRSKSERHQGRRAAGQSVNGDGQVMSSPTKSTSSGEGTLDERSSKEGSPVKELDAGSPTKGEKKKKKFRMPSFSAKKDKKKAK